MIFGYPQFPGLKTPLLTRLPLRFNVPVRVPLLMMSAIKAKLICNVCPLFTIITVPELFIGGIQPPCQLTAALKLVPGPINTKLPMGGYVLGWLFHHKMPPPIIHTSTDQMKIPSQVARRKSQVALTVSTVHKKAPQIIITSLDQKKIPSQVACRKLRPRYNTVHKKPPQSILTPTDKKKIPSHVACRMSHVACRVSRLPRRVSHHRLAKP